MRILGIETSCDETGIAVLEADGEILRLLSNRIASQIDIHKEYGGVYPMLAKRAHEENLPVVLAQALEEAGEGALDAIAVTHGPGLSPCLWTGVNFAGTLATERNVPLIPVDHVEAHLLIAAMEQEDSEFRIPKGIFPAIGLVVSGGHTQLVLMEDWGRYRIVGETQDDAAGEAFDKTARILGLEYPGGPAIAREASRHAESKYGIRLPRPMLHTKNYGFSFSGLKTAVLYEYRGRTEEERSSQEYVREMAFEIQRAIVDVLCSKTVRAAEEYGAKAVLLGGGVAANALLREELAKGLGNVPLLAPKPGLATDNGAMIAVAGFLHREEALEPGSSIEARPNLRLE